MILKLRYVIATTIATAALLSPTIASASNSSAHDGRRKLMPGSSIAQEVRNEHATGNSHPKFTLTGEVAGQSGNAFSIHVREPVPAVTSETTFSSFNGPKETVGNLGFTLLVADSDSDEEDGTIAIIAINDVTEEVNGIVQKKGQNMKFTQTKGNPAWAIEAEEFIPPAWACGVGSEEEAAGRRSLVEHGDHDHHDHDHEGHDHHDRESTEHTLAYLKENLRGSNIQMGKRRKLQSGGSYDFQVDVYIEVDQALVNDNGGIFNPNTINYVNSIFTGANTIYESEINTHLNILHITLNNNYDSSTSTSGALTTMRSIYSSQNFNYYDGPGRIDVHHALLSKSLGGGIAYLGVLCDSLYGFGLSASLSGQFASMDNAVVWDMMVVMHELGHNFNSGHTHNYPSPAIDTCGCSTDNTCSGSCPAELPLAKSSTIMSYCHLCSGGYNNMMYTFGGKYNGSGSRGTTSSYSNSNLQGTYSIEPRRVNVNMWNHVASRGTCLDVTVVNTDPTASPTPLPTKLPTEAPTSQPTNEPTSKPTGPTNAPTNEPTSTPTASPTPRPTNVPTNEPTNVPTTTANCPTINNEGTCSSKPNCEWIKKKGGACIFGATTPVTTPPPTSPSGSVTPPPTGSVTPPPTPPSNTCVVRGDPCPANPADCCNNAGCVTRGRNSKCN